MPRQGNKGKSSSGSKSVKLGPGFPPQLLNRLLRSQRRCIPFRNTFLTMYNTSQCSRGIPNKSDSEQKQDNFYYSSPKAATDMGVSSSESHDLTAFYEMLSASFGVLSQNTGFYPSLDRIIETMLRPLNLGPGGRSYNEPISRLHQPESTPRLTLSMHTTWYGLRRGMSQRQHSAHVTDPTNGELCPSALPMPQWFSNNSSTIHQQSPGEPTGCLHGRIHRQYPNLFGLHRPALGPRMRSAQTPSGSWTIREPQEVQLPHGYSRVPRVHTDSNRTPHGPGEGSHDPELAGTMKCP